MKQSSSAPRVGGASARRGTGGARVALRLEHLRPIRVELDGLYRHILGLYADQQVAGAGLGHTGKD